MPNSWPTQARVQVFYCEFNNVEKSVNMFERMEISDSIYEGVVEPSNKKITLRDTNSSTHRRQKIVEAASSWTPAKKGESAGKRRKRHVDSLTVK